MSSAVLVAHVFSFPPPEHGYLGINPPSEAPPELTEGDLLSVTAFLMTSDASVTQAATVATQSHLKKHLVVETAGRLVRMITRSDLVPALCPSKW